MVLRASEAYRSGIPSEELVRKKEAEATSVEKTGHPETLRASGTQERDADIQDLCMEYQQTCV